MAAFFPIECPPTPDGQTEFPATPPPNSRIREFLKSQHRRSPTLNGDRGNGMGVGNETNGSGARGDNDSTGSGDDQRQQDNQSPPPNCSICLGRVKSKCFTDSCMHQFCFSCLLEWSKIKPECPLCKQTFKSIIHNVTSMDSYDEYKVEEQQRHVNWISLPHHYQPLDLIFTSALPTYRVYRPEVAAQNRIYHLFLHESPLTERFARMYPNDNIPPRHSGVSWRSYVYQRRLYAMPLNDINGQRRTITAEFYRENPAQMHRLVPWLNRELISFVPTSPYPIGVLLRTIETLVQTFDITSRTFRRRVHAYIPQQTDHFIHEFVNYARSPYDIVGYDRNVMYSPVFDDDVNNVVALSSSDESDVIATGPPPVPIPTVITENRSAATASGSTSTSAGNSNGRRPVITTGTDPEAMNSTLIECSSDSSDVCINNEGSAFACMGWRNVCAGGSNQTGSLLPGEPTLINSSEDESEEVSAYTQNQAGPTFDNAGGRISPNTLRKTNSGRSVIVSLNFGSGSVTVRETPTSDGPSSSEVNGTPSEDVVATIGEITTPPAVGETVQVVTTDVTEPVQPTTASDDPPAANVIEESDSDECQFVCAKKPPHLRTPEYVELNSESDSDVVFVNEEVLPIPPTIKKESQNLDPSLWSMDASFMPDYQASSSAPDGSSLLPNKIKFSISGPRKRSRRKSNERNRYEISFPVWGDSASHMANSVIYENPSSASQMVAEIAKLEEPFESQPSTSSSGQTGARKRKYPRYLKSYIHSNPAFDNTDSDDSQIPLNRLLYQKPKRKGGKGIFESSSSSSAGPDSTDVGTSPLASCSSDAEFSSSSHEEYSLPSSRTGKRKPTSKTSPTKVSRKRSRKESTSRSKKNDKTMRIKKTQSARKRAKSSAAFSSTEKKEKNKSRTKSKNTPRATNCSISSTESDSDA